MRGSAKYQKKGRSQNASRKIYCVHVDLKMQVARYIVCNFSDSCIVYAQTGTHGHTGTHACMHAHEHARKHARTNARTHASTHACPARPHARPHARIHARTNARTRARTHARMYACYPTLCGRPASNSLNSLPLRAHLCRS